MCQKTIIRMNIETSNTVIICKGTLLPSPIFITRKLEKIYCNQESKGSKVTYPCLIACIHIDITITIDYLNDKRSFNLKLLKEWTPSMVISIVISVFDCIVVSKCGQNMYCVLVYKCT